MNVADGVSWQDAVRRLGCDGVLSNVDGGVRADQQVLADLAGGVCTCRQVLDY